MAPRRRWTLLAAVLCAANLLLLDLPVQGQEGGPPPFGPPLQYVSKPGQEYTALLSANVAWLKSKLTDRKRRRREAQNSFRLEIAANKPQVQKVIDQLDKEISETQAAIQKPEVTPQNREQMEKSVLNLQRQLQDLDNEARRVISKEQADIAVNIFKEIEQVVEAVAKTNNFDLVLSYPDGTTKDELYSQENVVRKLASQGTIPLFYKPHIDLTNAVVQTLNASFPAPVTPSSPPAPSAPQPPQK